MIMAHQNVASSAPRQIVTPRTKTCTRCSNELPVDSFSRCPPERSRDGRRSICRSCVSATRHEPSLTTRAERRREQKQREREAALALEIERAKALNYASLLTAQLEAAPDEQAKKDLRRMINGIRLRYAKNENDQRMAVLKALERRELVTREEIVDMTKLSRQIVQAILDDFTSAKVDLVFITTMGGKRDCGRNGTTLYYGLKH